MLHYLRQEHASDASSPSSPFSSPPLLLTVAIWLKRHALGSRLGVERLVLNTLEFLLVRMASANTSSSCSTPGDAEMKGTAALTLEERKQRRQFHLEAREARLRSTSSSSSLMTAHADMGGQLAATLKQRKEKSLDHDVAMEEQLEEQVQQSAKKMQEFLDEHNKKWQSNQFWRNQSKAAEEMEAAQRMYDAVRNAPHRHHRGIQQKQAPEGVEEEPRRVARNATDAGMDVDEAKEDGYFEVDGFIYWVGQRSRKWTHRDR